MVKVLDLDLRAGAGGNKLGHVALLAGESLVLAFQSHAGLRGVIERLAVQPDQGEFFAVMVGMATAAVRLARRTLILVRMKTRMGVQPMLDLNVTFEALKCTVPRARSEIVTRSALSHALILLMSARQGTGGYLGRRQTAAENRQGDGQNRVLQRLRPQAQPLML